MLTHNVFNEFSKSEIVAVPEDTFIPAGVDSETVEFDVILYNMLVIVHLEVIDSVFGVSGGLWDQTECGESGQNWVNHQASWEFHQSQGGMAQRIPRQSLGDRKVRRSPCLSHQRRQD